MREQNIASSEHRAAGNPSSQTVRRHAMAAHHPQHPASTSIAAVLLAGGLLCGATSVQAQGWPTRPVRMIVPFAVGGGTDIQARLFSTKLQPALGQQIIVDNRTGAGGNIGAELVAKAPPDGYTVLFQSATIAVNATLYRNLTYNATRDFAPVMLLTLQLGKATLL
jgi:tripartite-type tricarboxylate transporter receptor subunit TctC